MSKPGGPLSDSRGAYRACLILVVASCRAGEPIPVAEFAPREGVVELAVGEAAGAEEYTFGRISGLVADGSGRIYVADAAAHDVRVFDSAGVFLFRIGRRGQGPGELDGPCCLTLRDHDRTLWVRDGGNARYTSFAVGDTAATYRSAIAMAHRDVNRWAPVGFDAAGNLIDIGVVPVAATQATGSGAARRTGRFHLDSTGRVIAVDTVPEPPPDSVPVHTVQATLGSQPVTFFLYQPYGPTALVAHSPTGEMARAVSSRYSIEWRSPDGRVLRTVEQRREGPPLSDAERAAAEDGIARDMRRLSLARGQIPFDIPNRKPVIRSLSFDQDGRLWVEHYVAEGAPSTADVYAADATPLYQVTWPRRTDLVGWAIRGDILHAIQRDSLDISRVARMRLR